MFEDKIWYKMRKMQRRIDILFGNIGTGSFGKKLGVDGDVGNYRKARADFEETDNEFILEIELPGVEKEDIELNIMDSGIEIRAEKKQEKEREDKEKGEYIFSKSYAGFARYIDLPEEADLEKIDAEYKNGILEIRVPKKKIKVKNGKEIKIR